MTMIRCPFKFQTRLTRKCVYSIYDSHIFPPYPRDSCCTNGHASGQFGPVWWYGASVNGVCGRCSSFPISCTELKRKMCNNYNTCASFIHVVPPSVPNYVHFPAASKHSRATSTWRAPVARIAGRSAETR